MLKETLKRVLRAVGLDVQILRHWPNLHFFFRTWRKMGVQPRFIIDIGANHGDWSRIARSYFPDCEFLLCEPQERLKSYSKDLLSQKGFRWLTAGLSDVPGRMHVSLPAQDDTAALLPAGAVNGVPSAEVDVTTLDSLVQAEGRVPDIVKIDAEGFDMRVLRGGSSLFGRTQLFFVECAIDDANAENSLRNVCDFMHARQYRPIEMTDLNRCRDSGRLVLCEVCFAHTPNLRPVSPTAEPAVDLSLS